MNFVNKLFLTTEEAALVDWNDGPWPLTTFVSQCSYPQHTSVALSQFEVGMLAKLLTEVNVSILAITQ